MKEEKDDLTRRIVAGLGERKRKLDRMAEWEKPARHIPMWTVGTLLAAACVVLAILIFPATLGNDRNLMNDKEWARSAGVDIEDALTAGRYKEAMATVDSVLMVTDETIAELEELEQDEETAYELMAKQQKREGLLRLKKEIREKMKIK